MQGALLRGLTASAVIAASLTTPARAAHSTNSSDAPAVLQRFLTLDASAPWSFRALRHFNAQNDQFDSRAWMDVWTECDPAGFRYMVVGEGGSEYIRSRLFRASLETERKMWADGSPERAAVTPANYEFEDGGAQADGLASFRVKPRRKDMLLVHGSIFLNPDDGDLVRVEGRLSKSPSFWTRRVDIVRWYRRIAGVRVPVALETTASIRIAGKSTFKVAYDYEMVNGQRVGSPQLRTASGQ
jgi:hypothetical protein